MDFSDIVERSRALRSLQEASASTLTDQIPHLERPLPQIDLESRRLATATDHRTQPVSNARALSLLSEYGYETDKIERTLQSVALLDAFEPVQPTLDTDLQSYLDARNELIVAAAIDTTLRHAKDRSISSLSSIVDAEWDVAKRELLSLPLQSMSISPAVVNTPSSSRRMSNQLNLMSSTPTMGLNTPRRNTMSNNNNFNTPQAFTSPFRQPRSARVSSVNDSNMHSKHLVSSMKSNLNLNSNNMQNVPSSIISSISSLSIYNEIVKRIVYESGSIHRPLLKSTTNIIRVATEFDDCLLLHQAPRGDHNLASKHVQHLHAVFNSLRYIIGEHAYPQSHLPSSHSFDNWSYNKILNRIRYGSHQFLCLQFREDKMRREIELRPVEARRGGVPGMRADVRAFLNLVFDRGVPEQLISNNAPMYDGVPIWAFVYYLLRAGFIEESLNLIRDAIKNGCMQSSLLIYEECLRAFIESSKNTDDNEKNKNAIENEKYYCLPNHLLEKLVQEYGVNVKRSEDPYQRVCYVVIARIDPAIGDKISLLDSDYSLLFYSIEDYLWLRLSIARNNAGYRETKRLNQLENTSKFDNNISIDDDINDEALPESLAAYELGIEKIGKEIKQFGPTHFNAHGDSPIFYALVLMLTGQFKEAITYLEEKARALTEATHLAFILYHYGLIRDDSSGGRNIYNNYQSQSNSETDKNNQFVVDYAGLIWRYASKLCQNDPAVAAIYIFTIEDAMMRKELLKKLILECKGQYDNLLGRHGNGGVLAELWNKKGSSIAANQTSDPNTHNYDDWRSIVVEAGEECERLGDRENALKLYEIADVKSKMMDIHLSRVSSEISTISNRNNLNNMRLYIIDDAKRYLSALNHSLNNQNNNDLEDINIMNDNNKSLNSLKLLLDIIEFYELKWQGKSEEALSLLERMRLLPKEDGEVVGKVMELGYGSSIWCEQVIERVPEMIVNSMEVLGNVYTRREGVSEEERIRLRKWATSLVNLSGMMRNLSADMSARLVSLEVVMN